jgi:signal transduction histidine kinase
MSFPPQAWHFFGSRGTVGDGMDRGSACVPVTHGVPGPVTPSRPTRVSVALLAAAGAATLAIAEAPVLYLAAAYACLTAITVAAVFAYGPRRATAGAVFEERRRIARDLHDGLAQDLAYIRLEASRLAAHEPEGRAARLAMAAQRALEESRGAIAALRGDGDKSFADELSSVARGLAERDGASQDTIVEVTLP